MTVLRLEPQELAVVEQIAALCGKTAHEVITQDFKQTIELMRGYLESSNPHDIDDVKQLWG